MSSTLTPTGQMPGDSKSVLAAALALSERERADIAARLLESIDEREGSADEAPVDAAWAKEADARYQAYKRGEVKSISIEEFGRKL